MDSSAILGGTQNEQYATKGNGQYRLTVDDGLSGNQVKSTAVDDEVVREQTGRSVSRAQLGSRA